MQTVSQLLIPTLSSLRDDDSLSSNIQYVKHCLQTRGWVLVKNDVFKGDDVCHMFGMFDTFCQMPLPFKTGFSKRKLAPSLFGYLATDRSEGYHFVTGIYTQFFKEYVSSFAELPKEVDLYCRNLLTKNGATLFNTLPHANVSHIPMYRKDYATTGFGLFDIVRYASTGELQSCGKGSPIIEDRVDRGLLSLHMGSSADGLQVFDYAAGNWALVPSDAWVLMCGKEAEQLSKGIIRPARYRVIPNEQPRISAWYEVCVEAQVPKELIKTTPPPPPVPAVLPHPPFPYTIPPQFIAAKIPWGG